MMDSRQLYNAAAHLSQVVSWDREWIHFGTADQIKFDMIQNLIGTFLSDDQIILVHNRRDSACKDATEIEDAIEGLLGKEEFQLWNSSMDKVIQFDDIGVLLLGRK
jgi:hypothetical protein